MSLESMLAMWLCGWIWLIARVWSVITLAATRSQPDFNLSDFATCLLGLGIWSVFLSIIWLLRYLLFVLTDPCLTCCIWSTGYNLLPEIHVSPVSPHVIQLIHPITMKKGQHVPLLYLELFCLQRSSAKNYVFKKSFPLYSFVQVCTFPFEFKTHISPSVYECFSCPRAKLEELRRPHHTP